MGQKKKYTEEEIQAMTETDIKDPRYRILYRILNEILTELRK